MPLKPFHHLNHKTWLKDRNNGIGSSDTAIICGESNYMTPYELWRQKKFGEQKEVSEETQKLFAAGHAQEPVTLHRFLLDNNEPLADKVYLSHLRKKNLPADGNIHIFTEFKNGNLISHPDMIYKMGKRWVNIEAKYIRHKHNEWNFHNLTSSGVPYQYWIQCQFQMMLTGITKTILAANYQGSDFYYFEIDALKEFYKILKSRCFNFWNLVKKGEPPPPESEDDTKKLFPEKTNKSIQLDGEFLDQLMMMKVRKEFLSQKIKKLLKEKDSIKAYARAILAEHNIIQTADGEEVARLTESETEKHTALSIIKKDHPSVYKYLKVKGLILPKYNSKVIF